MSAHPYHDVAIAGIFNTEQARVLEGEDSLSISFKAALGALADAGLGVRDVDGVVGQFANDFVYQARLAPVWVTSSWSGIPAILQAATAIAAGMATKVLVMAGTAGRLRRPRRRPRPGPGRATSSSRRSACSPRPSSRWSRAATCTCYGTKPDSSRPSRR